MAADIIISKKDESFLNIDCETAILYELKSHFTFDVPNAKYSPKFKAKVWDGKISLLDLRFATLPLGLYTKLLDVAKSLGYTTSTVDTKFGNPNDKTEVTYEEVKSFMDSLNIHSNNNKLVISDYQYRLVYDAIYNQRLIGISPTGSGKSLIFYSLFRWYESKGLSLLLIVPNISLLSQMISDFEDYSSHNGFDVQEHSQTIKAGKSKVITKALTVSTWQSIYEQSSSWLNNSFDVVSGDEIHLFGADSLKGIFERATNVKFKVGFTGTLAKAKVNTMVLEGTIGNIVQYKTTRELINEGRLSDVKIHAIILKYNKDSSKLFKNLKKDDKKSIYNAEIDFLVSHDKRNTFIRNLALSLKGNTLILFNLVDKHGVPLYEDIKKNATTQEVYLVCGGVADDERDQIRKLVQLSEKDTITCASVGTMSTGTNIPRIHNIIFAAPSKSIYRVIQSMGRGLRLSEDKKYLNLFDIGDAIVQSKVNPNSTLKHFAERLKIYTEEGHPYKIIEVQLEK